MSGIYTKIATQAAANRKMFAVLIDPEKCSGKQLLRVAKMIDQAKADFIFVGGSQLAESVQQAVSVIKSQTEIPVLLFPGNVAQLCSNSDAILLLSLISGKNVELIVGQHIRAAEKIKQTSTETISTGYILVDGGNKSAVETMSGTQPIAADNIDLIKHTAVAGELLGNKLIYLEAGSGAKNPINSETISAVRKAISVPLIVGGGICSENQIKNALNAGADLVVVGNFLEKNPEKIADFAQCVKEN